MQQLDDASSLSDDVFEDFETTQKRHKEKLQTAMNPFVESEEIFKSRDLHSTNSLSTSKQQSSNSYQINKIRQQHYKPDKYSNMINNAPVQALSTPTGAHRSPSIGYRTSREALHLYGFEDVDNAVGSFEDGWKSYRYDDENSYQPPPAQPFDDTVNHKTILLGDSGVGKTSFLVKYNTGDFRLGSFSATVGIALTNKVVLVDGTKVKLQIWDTAGQERFKSVTHAYYRDAHALLLLYDVTHRTTFDNIRAWLSEIREYAQEDVVILLLGNKSDCSNSERQVKKEDGERLGEEYDVPFMETSAKTGLNVDLAFSAIARQLKSRGYNNGHDGRFNVHDFVRDNTKTRSMCAQCRNM